MPDFADLSMLESHILNSISKAMQNEVADVVKKEESKQIKKYYNMFTPKFYERRMDDGGLSDINNMRTITPKINNHSVSMTIKNETAGNPDYNESQTPTKNLAGIFYSGQGYNYHGVMSKYYERPRPANEDAIEELQRNKRHISALIEGLEKKGIFCS